VELRADNGANLNYVAPDVLKGLVRYGFRSIRCSIDGVSQSTYGQYRVRGELDKVIQNIKAINRFKLQFNSEFPHLHWVFIAFGHNEHEIQAAKEIAARLGMNFHLKLSWDSELSPVRHADLIRLHSGTGTASREEYRARYGRDYMDSICRQLWERPQINWDGKVLGCCRNFWGDFGANAFTDGLEKSINSEKMRYARAMLNSEREPRTDIPCTTCSIYLYRAGKKQL
jgi:MoaA/NifB/PqqE/SkfB family radical SAM enzyme